MSEIILEAEEIGKGSLILVNAAHPLGKAGRCRRTFVDENYPEIFLNIKAVTCLKGIIEEIKCKDAIIPVSGFRSRAEQEQIFRDSLRNNGIKFTKRFVALPDCSEHQTGLAVDLGLNQEEIDFIRPDFPYEGVCGQFREKAPKYGFIERYAADKEEITGISHEPWHFRYVGYPHSEIMTQNNLCLEEYIEYLKNFPYKGSHLWNDNSGKAVEIFYVSEETGKTGTVKLPEHAIADVSGNNVDGWIVTVWRQ